MKKCNFKDFRTAFTFKVGKGKDRITYNPSVSKGQCDFEGWAFYCIKAGEYIGDYEMFYHPWDYRKRKGDIEAWK